MHYLRNEFDFRRKTSHKSTVEPAKVSLVDVPLTQNQLQKYTCPMHPQIMQDAPGKCPLCGMTLEPVANKSYGKANHTGMIADFKKDFMLYQRLLYRLCCYHQWYNSGWISTLVSPVQNMYCSHFLQLFSFMVVGHSWKDWLMKQGWKPRYDVFDWLCNFCCIHLQRSSCIWFGWYGFFGNWQHLY